MSFRSDLLHGVFYTAIAKYSGMVVQVLISAILARILSPNDFGIIAIATVFITFFSVISEVGIGSAIVQRKELGILDIQSIFTVTIFLGTFLSALLFALSNVIGEYYESDALSNICKWLSLQLLFGGFDIVPNALLLKAKKFGLIAARTFVVNLICGILSVVAALNGLGIYSLVISAVLSKILVFLVNYYCNPLKMSFEFNCLSVIGSYSFFQFLCNLLAYFSRNFDKMIIGKFLNMEQLGYYEKSYRLMMLPLSNITFVVTPVMHPVFSEMQNDVSVIADKYCKIIRLLACITFPLSVILYFGASDIIYIFFGGQWEQSIPPFKILALSVGLQIIHSTAGSIYQSINYTKGLFAVALISSIIQILGFFVALQYVGTLESVACSFVITFVFNSFMVFKVLFNKMNKSFYLYIKQILLPMILSIIVFVILYFSPIHNYENVVVSLLVKSVCVLVLTFLSYYIFNIADIRNFIGKKISNVLSKSR